MTDERKTAVVTGAAAGIGQAYAKRLAEDGVDIVIADIGDPAETIEMIRGIDVRTLAVECDVSSEEQVHNLAESVQREFGGADILVNDAGVMPIKKFEQVDLEMWRHVQAVNIDAMFLTAKAFVGPMVDRGWGRIINQTSNTFGLPVQGFTHYVTSKAAIVGLTRSLASEFGPDGITVNAIAPGLTATETVLSREKGAAGQPLQQEFDEMIAAQVIKRIGKPEDLVGALSFLASEDSSFMTGQTLVVDGGLWRT